MVGATVEELGFDTRVTVEGIHRLLHDAAVLVPGLLDLELAEIGAGLRPGSPDNEPVIGTTPVDGLVVATGHHRNGILLTPVTADAVAGLFDVGPDGARDRRLRPRALRREPDAMTAVTVNGAARGRGGGDHRRRPRRPPPRVAPGRGRGPQRGGRPPQPVGHHRRPPTATAFEILTAAQGG